MRGLQLLALVLLSARANARAPAQPSEHEPFQDHSDHHVKHIVLEHPLDRAHQDYFPLDHNSRSEDSEHKQPSEGHILEDQNHPRDSHTWHRSHSNAGSSSAPEVTRHHVKSSEDLNSPSHHHHSPSKLHHPSEGSDRLQYLNVEPSPEVILQYVKHLEDVRNPSHLHSHKHSHSSENSNHAKTEKKNLSPSEDVNFTFEDQAVWLKAPPQDKVSQDYSKDLTLTLDDRNAMYEDEGPTYEDVTYEDRSLTSEDKRATYEERNLTSEDERSTYEERNLTSEDERATYEERSLISEDKRSTYLTSEDKKATDEERNSTSKDERVTYEERDLTSENERTTHEKQNLTSEKHSRPHHSRGSNRSRKTKHSRSSRHPAPNKTMHPKHFYSSSRIYPKFAKQLSQILRPFFHIQETSDELPFNLTRERLVHNGNSVEILPLHPNPVNQDSKTPLALILGGPKRDKGRKKYFYSKKHKHGHVKASVEIMDNESDEKPESDTHSGKSNNIGTAVTSEVGNVDEGVIYDEGVNQFVNLDYGMENDSVVVLLKDIQSNTVYEPLSNKKDLDVSNNENKRVINDDYINASTENTLGSIDNDFLTEESNSDIYSVLDSSVSGPNTLSSSLSDNSELGKVSIYPSMNTLFGEKKQFKNVSDEKESDRSSDYTQEEKYTGDEDRDVNYSVTSENEGTDVSVTNEKYYSTTVIDGDKDDSIKDGIKEQLYNFALGSNGENKNDLLDDFDELTSENLFNDDYSTSDRSKSSENRTKHDTNGNNLYALEELLNEELTTEDNDNYAPVDEKDDSIKEDGIKKQFYNFALGSNGENKNDLLDDFHELTSENLFNDDYSTSDRSKSSENRPKHDTNRIDLYALEEILNEELTTEDNDNHAPVDEKLNRIRNHTIVTNDVRNVINDLTEENSEGIEIKFESDDDKRGKYVLQFQLPVDKKSDTKVGLLEELKSFLKNHQRSHKSYNLSFLFQK